MRILTENLTFTTATTHSAEFHLPFLEEVLSGITIEVSDPNDLGLTYSSYVYGGTDENSVVLSPLSYTKPGDTYHISKIAFPYVKVFVTITDMNGESEATIQCKLVY